MLHVIVGSETQNTSFTSGIIKIWVQESSASAKSTFLNSHGHPSERVKWKSGKDC